MRSIKNGIAAQNNKEKYFPSYIRTVGIAYLYVIGNKLAETVTFRKKKRLKRHLLSKHLNRRVKERNE